MSQDKTFNKVIISNPFLSERRKGFFAISVICLVVVIVLLVFQSALFALITLMILVLPISHFFVSTKFEFQDGKILATQLNSKKEIPYKKFDNAELQNENQIVLFIKKNKFKIYLNDNDKVHAQEILLLLKSKIKI